MGTRRRCRRSLRRISRIRAVSGGDIVQRSEFLLCSQVPCAEGEAVHGGVSGVYQFYLVIFIPAFREFHEQVLSAFHEYQGHAHSALTGMWGALQHRLLHTYRYGVRTYTQDITLQVFFFFLYTTPPIRRRLALSSSLQLLWIDCAVLGVAGRLALLGRNRGSRCSRIGYYWCKSTLRSRLGLVCG